MTETTKTQNTEQENKMGVMPVNKLLITMSLPMMISMIVQALYNIVDSIFVARLGENALTAVSLAFPLQNLMIAVASGTGVGINAMLSKSLGEKRFDNADRAANNGVFLAFLSFIAFALIGIIFAKPYFMTQTTEKEIVDYGCQYILICCVLSIGIFGQITFERLLQSTGKTFFTMITQGTGAIINLIFDPILIFGLLGFPKLGVSGAALATVFGQIVAFIMALIFNIKINKEIHLGIKHFKPNLNTIKRIYSVGIPSIIMMTIASVMVYVLNLILMSFTATATAVLGIYFKLQSFIFMPVFGLNNGIVPIVSYNFGAQHRKRIIKTLRLGVTYAVSLMIIGFIIFQTIPVQLFALFDASQDMLDIGVPALKIISFSFLMAGFSIISITVFQSFGRGVTSLIISVVRQLVVLLPAAYLLSKTGQVQMVWLAFPIAEISAFVMCIVFLRKLYIKEIKPMPE